MTLSMELFALLLTLDLLGWPLGLGLADVCRSWKAVVLACIQSLAAERYVPLEAAEPRLALLQFWRRAGYLDATRHLRVVPWNQVGEGPGLHMAVAHVFGRWRPDSERPPAYMAAQQPCPEAFPEALQWLLKRGTFMEWRSWRSYRRSTVPRHEILVERWDVALTVDGFRWQRSHADHTLLRIAESPDPVSADDEAWESVKHRKIDTLIGNPPLRRRIGQAPPTTPELATV